MSLDNVVAKLSRLANVTRTAAVSYGTNGRPAPQTSSVTPVRMSIQPDASDDQERELDGDEAVGRIAVHVTNSALAAVGWTELQTTPAPDAVGPPADRVEYQGRLYEIIERGRWELEGFNGPARFQRYVAELRGEAPP